MSELTAERIDAQHPWVGLASFTEDERGFFAGRNSEIEELGRLIMRDNLTLLYGVSGLGKTSLLQAGVFPILREDNYLPVPIRLDYLEGTAPLATQVLDAITKAASDAGVEAPQPRPADTLWEYFHRQDNHFWSRRNELVTPFLVFDQFEEFFTLGRNTPERDAQGEAFITQLADLVENRPPATLRDDPAHAKEFNFKSVPIKVLFSMREDYLAELDRIRLDFRALGQNRLRLLPMGERQARQVIELGAPLLAPGVEDRIVKYVAGPVAESNGADLTIAPALLSLVLRELNERRLAHGPEAKITSNLLDVEQDKIFEDFYLRTLQGFPECVHTFIEDRLLTAAGYRDNCTVGDAGARWNVTDSVLKELVNRRLLAYDERHERVELTHDVLVPVIKAKRDSRLTRQAQAEAERLRRQQVAQKRKQRITATVAGALAVALVATIWGGYYFFLQEHRAYYRSFAKKNGFPVGIKRLSKAEASKLTPSFLLTSKGIKWKGWKPEWKPAFRMVAVDWRFQPTTNHSVRTYLWRGESEAGDTREQSQKAEQLGLQKVCQWEFVPNAAGDIMYERGLDRDGRMVFGLVYSPVEAGSSNARLAHFVGPDGFPQLQRKSAAEYVAFDYDANGWEKRIMYRDGKNHPAVGPDGAFGMRIEHDEQGQSIGFFSLDADGNPMIDDSGNCGMQESYNKQGLESEAHSVGPDLKPMPVNGYVVAKYEYDDFGRVRRTRFYGLRDEPVLLQKDRYHGWEWQYDEHGNRIATTFLGLDGSPMLLPDGYAKIKSEFGAQGKPTRIGYYNVKDKPALSRGGYQRREGQYDDRGNLTAVAYFGLDQKPTLIPEGYASAEFAYDARSRWIGASYFGINREPVLHRDGNHGWKATYDERGNQTELTYVGLDEKPCMTTTGYAIEKSKYDSDGNELESAYFDAAGNPTLDRRLGVYKIARTYDGRGKIIEGEYYGVSGEPVTSKDGYHGWRSDYDSRGNNTLTSFFGRDGKLTRLPDGYAIVKSKYDARGKQTEAAFFDMGGKPTPTSEGLARWIHKYDDRGREIERAFFDANNKPIALKDGYARVTKEYDDRGNQIEEAYFDVTGKSTPTSDGLARRTKKYDERDQEIEIAYFDVSNKPVAIKNGYARITKKYDERGNQTEEAYLGVDGKPTPTDEGIARWTYKYDERDREIERAFFDVNNNPVALKNGYARVAKKYDERSNQIEAAYFDVTGKPALTDEGLARWTHKFDERNREIERAFFDANNNPVALKNGYARVTKKYDERGNEIEEAYFDKDGRPIRVPSGYAVIKWEYDGRGNQVEEAYFDVDGQPIRTTDGYSIVKMEYDERGNRIRVTVYGINKEPVANKNGQHAMVTRYDERGNAIERVYFDVNDKSIPSK